MKLKSALISSILGIGISLAPPIAQSQSRKSQPTGQLKITLKDLNDSVIQSNEITVRGRVIRTCRSDTKGECEFELPAGIYRVFAHKCSKVWICFPVSSEVKECWHRFERAPFHILPGRSLWINLLPEEPAFITYCHGLKSPPGLRKDVRWAIDPPKYVSISIDSSLKPALNLLVQFKTNRESKGFVEYGSADSTPGKPNVIVSYDALTIYADRIRISKSPLRLRAVGQVVIEDGKQRKYASEIDLTFNGGVPTISVVH
jgi:hypothetical protein